MKARKVIDEVYAKDRLLAGHPLSSAFFLPPLTGPGASQRKHFNILEQFTLSASGNNLFEATREGLRSGGVIVLSHEINAGAGDGFVAKLRNTLKSLWQRVHRVEKATTAVSSVKQDVGFSIGNLFRGRYVDPTGAIFDEKSFAIEIVGVSSEELEQMAEALRSEFKQQAVLVKDHNSRDVYFLRA